MLPERGSEARACQKQDEGAGHAASGRAAPDEAEQGEKAERDEDQPLQHAPRARLHAEAMLRDQRRGDRAERGEGAKGEQPTVARPAGQRAEGGPPATGGVHSPAADPATWAISSISTQAPSGSWATP